MDQQLYELLVMALTQWFRTPAFQLQLGVSSDSNQLTCQPKPARTEGPRMTLNPVYGWSRVGK